jgi:hypothetical protein
MEAVCTPKGSNGKRRRWEKKMDDDKDDQNLASVQWNVTNKMIG